MAEVEELATDDEPVTVEAAALGDEAETVELPVSKRAPQTPLLTAAPTVLFR